MSNRDPWAESFDLYVHNSVSSEVRFLETKGAAILSLSGGAIAFLVKQCNPYTAMTGLIDFPLSPPPYLIMALPYHHILSLITSTILFVAFCCAFRSAVPRFGPVARSLVFYRAIAQYKDADTYISEISSAERNTLSEAVLRDTHSVASIANTKAKWLTRASWCLFIGILSLVLTIFACQAASPHHP